MVPNRVKKTTANTKPKYQIVQARSPQRPSRDYEGEKRRLLDVLLTIEESVSQTEFRLNDVKRGHQKEKERVMKKSEDLRRKKSKLEDEVQTKRKTNL